MVTYYAIPVIITVANAKKLYDEPDDVRKIHAKPIPSLGGLGMFIGFTLCLLLTINFWKGASEFQFYMAAFLVTFCVGIKDDILVLSAGKKFLGQLIIAAILIVKANLVIDNMHGFLGLYQIDKTFSYLLTVFAMVVIINAYNLIDGVDGLAGSVGLVTSLCFGIFFLINGNIPYAVLGFGFSGSLLAFLIYNFHPAKIFMGDTGSLLIGVVNSILVLKFIQTGSTYTVYPVLATPAVGFGIMLLPLMDTLRVFGNRILKGKSPFSPDRNHFHHLLLDKGCNHRSVTLICIGLTIGFIVLSFALESLGSTKLILLQMSIFFGGVYLLHANNSRGKLRVVKSEKNRNGTETEKNVRLVSIFAGKTADVAEED